MKSKLLPTGNLLLEIGPTHPEYARLRESTLAELLHRFRQNGHAVSLSAIPAPLRVPKGHGQSNPLYIAGKAYVGGEFIPHAELAKASEQEKAQLQQSIAAEGQQQPSEGNRVLPRSSWPVKGEETSIPTPSGDAIKSRYEVRELSEVIGSNRVLPGGSFQDMVAAGKYPKELQPRNYTENASERSKVLRLASNLVPAYLVSDHPDATSGPPIINEQGHVLSGNGRNMALEMARNLGNLPKYRDYLLKKASQFGIDPKDIAGMKEPVLYRVVDLQGEEAAKLARSANIAPTQSQGVAETAAALSHLIPGDISDQLNLGPETTFSQAVSGPAGKAFRERLLSAIRSEAPTMEADLFEKAGTLTEKGTEFVRQMLLTKFLPPALIRSLGEQRRQLMNGIEAATPQLLLLQRGQGGVNISPQMREALEVFGRNADMKTAADVDAVLSQGSLYGGMQEPISAGARMMLDFLVANRDTPKQLRKGLVELAGSLHMKSGGLFGEQMGDTAGIAAEALGVKQQAGATFGNEKEVEHARHEALAAGHDADRVEEALRRGQADGEAEGAAAAHEPVEPPAPEAPSEQAGAGGKVGEKPESKEPAAPSNRSKVPEPPEPNFTGTLTDALGRVYYFKDGKRVAKPKAPKVDKNRVLVDGVPYHKDGSYWVNEHDPDSRATNSLMDKWRLKGRVKEVPHGDENQQQLEGQGAEGTQGGVHRGELAGDAGSGAAGEPAGTGQGTGAGLPELSDSHGGTGPRSPADAAPTGDEPARGAGAGDSGSHEPRRVNVGGDIYRQEGADWVNEAKPEYRASDSTMKRWQQKGRVQPIGSDAIPASAENPTDTKTATNFRYAGRDFLKHGAKAKFNANIEAIKTLAAIKAEGRTEPTVEEQQILSQYVGWGQFPGVFNEYGEQGYSHIESEKWKKERAQLRELITDDEWNAARASTKNAHFTDPSIVDAHWKMAERLGFKGGRFLETSAGIGYYLGMMPGNLAGKVKSTAVEQDSLSAQILAMLYPATKTYHQGFEDHQAPDNFYDLVASNVPFGGYKVHDKRYNKYAANIHDYFFLKSADLAKAGGLIMHITSTGTLDKPEDKIRQALAAQCDLVGAIRFPKQAHKAGAGTDVVTDLVILRKRHPDEKPVSLKETPTEAMPSIEQDQAATEAGKPGFTGITTDSLGRLYHWKDGKRVPGPNWMDVTTVPDPAGGQPITVNKYFAEYPEQVLGHMDRSGTMRGGDEKSVSKVSAEELTKALGQEVRFVRRAEEAEEGTEEATKHGSFLFADGSRVPAEDIERVADAAYQAKLAAAIEGLPRDVAKTDAKSKAAFEPEKMPAPGDVKEGGYSIQNGKLFVREGGALVEHAPIPKESLERIQALMEVRDAIRATLNAQLQGQDAGPSRAELNRVYDAFVAKHGFLNDKSHKHLFGDDPDYPVLLAAEKYDPKTKKATKADIFVKDTIRAVKTVEHAGTVGEALGVSLHETGRVDVERMAKLTGRDQSSIAAELVQTGLAFQDPSEGWMPADLYLSGNVRKKLALARTAAATDPMFDANVAALEKVQPEDVPHTEITVKIGAPWLPPSDITAFANELLATRGGLKVTRNPATGDWHAGFETERAKGVILGSQLAQKWATKRKDFRELLNAALNNQSIIVKDKDEKGDEHVNKEETDAAQAKIQEIKDAFRDWIWTDDDRRERLHRSYNDNFNNIRPVHYNGSHQTFPGMNPGFKMRSLQENFVWQVVTTGRGLAGHEVGTGKTASMIAAAMELRRLGLAKKPAIACLKANVEQITREARDLYPGAKILSMANMFDAAKRKKTMSQIATGDYDMVIVSHDNLNMMKMLPETEAKYIRDEIDELTAAKLAYEAEQGGAKKGDRVVKALETAQANLEAKLKTALEGGRKDNQLYFEESGIDQLFVDEAHNYKSLPVYTKMQRVKGIPTNRSQRATSMLMRTRWLMENNNGRGVVMATGTPVANTMGELYNMQRYLQPNELKERGIKTFDDWANVFGEMNTKMEFTVAGEYKPVTRFAEFVNLPELMQIAGQTIDIQRVENLPPGPPTEEYPNGKPAIIRPHRHDKVIAAPHSDAMASLMASLKDRAQKVKQRHGPPQKGDDNMLTICTDGRKGAIDMRLLDPNAPDDPSSKVNMAVNNILAIAKAKPGMAQLLFSDVGVHPVKAAKVKVKGLAADEESEKWQAALADEPEAEEGDEDAAERESVMAGSGKFHLYQNIIDKLVAGGIPREKIADFSTLSGAKKEEAAQGLRDGTILVGIGGTKKMGTGMNVQTRLAALHHLDVPWLPADVEQRDGRGWRSGNKNKDLDVFRYVSEGSLDQTFWQIVGNKAKFINQVMNGKSGTRSVKDEDSEVLTPDQLMAAASGDPRILEKVNLDEDVRNLESAEKRHASEQTRMKDQVRKGKDIITELHGRAKKMHDLAGIVDAHLKANPDFSITIGEKTFTDRKEAGEALAAETAKPRGEMTNYGYWRSQEAKLGHYRGLDVMMNGQKVFLRSPDGIDVPTGEGLGSIEYITRKLPEAAGKVEAEAAKTAADLEKIGASIGKPYPKKEELHAKRTRLKELAAQLKKAYQPDDEKEPQSLPMKAADDDESDERQPIAASHDVSNEPRDDHGRWTVASIRKTKSAVHQPDGRRDKNEYFVSFDDQRHNQLVVAKDHAEAEAKAQRARNAAEHPPQPAADKWTDDFFAPQAEQGSLFGNETKHLAEPPTLMPQEKIGHSVRIMGEDMAHAEGQEVDGMVFDRFETETGGAVRVTDADSGNVVSIKKYPSLDGVRAGYADLVGKARRMSGERDFGLSAERAPQGYTREKPLRIGGNSYIGGEWIPGDVVAKATPQEKAQLGGQSGDVDEKPMTYKEFVASGRKDGDWEEYAAQQNAKSRARNNAKFEKDWHAGVEQYGVNVVNHLRAKGIELTPATKRVLQDDDTKVSKTGVTARGLSRSAAAKIHKEVSVAMLKGGESQKPASAQASAQRPAPSTKPSHPIAAEEAVPPPPGGYMPNPTHDANGDGVADYSRVGVPAMNVPPPPAQIPRLPNFTRDERGVEGRFARLFEKHVDALVSEYQRRLDNREIGDAPNIYNTDDAKLLSGDYNPRGVPKQDNLDAKSRYNLAVHATANAIAKRAFVKKLDEIAQMPEDKRRVLVTSGGVAAGKGYAIGKVEKVNAIAQQVAAVWDAAGEQNATENPWIMAECRKRGIRPTFVFVNADPQTTWENPKGGVVERAGGKGRMVDARPFAESYVLGAKNFHAFHEANKGRGDADFFVINNPRGADPTELAEVPESIRKADVEAIYERASKYLQDADVRDAIKRGGNIGLRVWPKDSAGRSAVAA